MLPESSTSLTALFHGCDHLKLLECVVDGTEEVVLEVRCLQKTDISSYQQKRTGAPQLNRWQISFLRPQESRSPEKNCCQTFEGRGGLYARRPVVCVPLTRQHRTARLQWCREHHNWTEQDWACVLFSDESRFSLSLDCRRQLIWRESGTAYRPENIQEKDRYPTCSIMVWAGIMINGRTRLHVVANGTMMGQRYIDEVLLPHVRLFRGAVGDKYVFYGRQRTMSSNTCCSGLSRQRGYSTSRMASVFSRSKPIENVWDALGRQVAGRNYPPTNKNTLIRALTEEWDKLPQQLLDNVVQSMDNARPHIVRLVKNFLEANAIKGVTTNGVSGAVHRGPQTQEAPRP
ncbi:transposable element Tcb2 transposase [Trichonephila clavipes]|uniref:Transposable element Tcb2 transposase n=1 Tax=Trichonephila clavipes TaxID=2585209 RepID=A0A8X6SX09_TRICX|nr:transposable element Tcb2 transposase [Trichonephila clavipes]